jgi:hypothetical protein
MYRNTNGSSVFALLLCTDFFSTRQLNSCLLNAQYKTVNSKQDIAEC